MVMRLSWRLLTAALAPKARYPCFAWDARGAPSCFRMDRSIWRETWEKSDRTDDLNFDDTNRVGDFFWFFKKKSKIINSIFFDFNWFLQSKTKQNKCFFNQKTVIYCVNEFKVCTTIWKKNQSKNRKNLIFWKIDRFVHGQPWIQIRPNKKMLASGCMVLKRSQGVCEVFL